MKPVSRGILAVIGFITGFLSLVFLFQTNRYLGRALAGDELSLGIFGIYLIMSYVGVSITVLAFKPNVTVAKYLSGAGVGVGVLLLLVGVYLFTTNISSGMMLLIFTGVQFTAAGIIYAVAHVRGDSDGEPDPESDPVSPESEPGPKPEPTEPVDDHTLPREPADTSDSEQDTGRNIDWWGAAQIFAGVTVFLIGIPITVQSPVGVPILLIGLALIPRVRTWSMATLGRSETEQ